MRVRRQPSPEGRRGTSFPPPRGTTPALLPPHLSPSPRHPVPSGPGTPRPHSPRAAGPVSLPARGGGSWPGESSAPAAAGGRRIPSENRPAPPPPPPKPTEARAHLEELGRGSHGRRRGGQRVSSAGLSPQRPTAATAHCVPPPRQQQQPPRRRLRPPEMGLRRAAAAGEGPGAAHG